MNAYKVETILSEAGALTLKDLPFHVGDAVEVIILDRSCSVPVGETALKGLGETSSQSEKAVEDSPNLLGMGRIFSGLCRSLGFLENIFSH
jgi:hypothetical protein